MFSFLDVELHSIFLNFFYQSLILLQTRGFVSFQLYVFSSRSPSEATTMWVGGGTVNHHHTSTGMSELMSAQLKLSLHHVATRSIYHSPPSLLHTESLSPAERWRREMEHHFMLKHKSEALIVTSILSVNSIYMLI